LHRFFAARAVCRSCWMLSLRNMPRFVRTTGLLAATCLMLALGQTPVMAQSTIISRVDWSHGQRVYARIQNWMQAGKTDDTADPIMATDFGGMHLTVRWLGRTVAESQVTYDSTDQALDQPTDLIKAARTVTGTALLRLRSLAEGSSADSLARVAGRTQIDLQIALRFRPINVLKDAAPDQVLRMYTSGFEGLRMTAPGKPNLGAWMWPATALARNFSPKAQMIGLLRDLGFSHDAVKHVARPNGPALQAFEVIHIVQPSTDQPVMRLVRGNRMLPATVLDTATLNSISARFAAHLARKQRENGTMAGTYRPSADRYDPQDATLNDQALALFALARWIQLEQRINTTEAMTLDAEAAVRQGVDYLRPMLLPRVRAEDAAAAALFVMACIETNQQRQTRNSIVNQFVSWQKDDGSFVRLDPNTQNLRPLSLAHQSIITAAIAMTYEHNRAGALQAPLRMALLHLTSSGAANNMAALPWLAMAYRALPYLPPAPDVEQNPHRMFESLQLLLKHQVLNEDDLYPTDVVGGFVLELTPPGAQPRPDWRTAHGLLLISVILRQAPLMKALRPTLTENEMLLRAGMSARFLAQLMFAEPSCFYIAGRNDALDGIRRSLFNNLVDVNSTAMALLATTELRAAMSE